jgi:hypothetical protein
MEERDLVAVPEGVCNQRRRALEDEFADGSVEGAEEVHAEVPEPVHDAIRRLLVDIMSLIGVKSTGVALDAGTPVSEC